uniref:Putative secreted peptide n=1 Tax=Anopheles braziliensis TaxID=58242 RepID=A0A2M3ZQC6_9DIPT
MSRISASLCILSTQSAVVWANACMAFSKMSCAERASSPVRLFSSNQAVYSLQLLRISPKSTLTLGSRSVIVSRSFCSSSSTVCVPSASAVSDSISGSSHSSFTSVIVSCSSSSAFPVKGAINDSSFSCACFDSISSASRCTSPW